MLTHWFCPTSVSVVSENTPPGFPGRQERLPLGTPLKGAQITGITDALGSLLSLDCARVLR